MSSSATPTTINVYEPLPIDAFASYCVSKKRKALVANIQMQQEFTNLANTIVTNHEQEQPGRWISVTQEIECSDSDSSMQPNAKKRLVAANDSEASASASTSPSRINLVPVFTSTCGCCGKIAPTFHRSKKQAEGVLHTLYEYRTLFQRLYALYLRRIALGHQSKDINSMLEVILREYQIMYRSRPASLVHVFEEGLPATLCIRFNIWTCPTLQRAISLASRLLFWPDQTITDVHDTLGKFYYNCLYPTLIYLHIALARRGNLPKATQRRHHLNLATLHTETQTVDNTIFKFLLAAPVEHVEQQSPKFYQHQEANGRSDALVGQVHKDVEKALSSIETQFIEGRVLKENVEAMICSAMGCGPRSASEYILQSDIDIPNQQNEYLCYRDGQLTLITEAVDTNTTTTSTTKASATNELSVLLGDDYILAPPPNTAFASRVSEF